MKRRKTSDYIIMIQIKMVMLNAYTQSLQRNDYYEIWIFWMKSLQFFYLIG